MVKQTLGGEALVKLEVKTELNFEQVDSNESCHCFVAKVIQTSVSKEDSCYFLESKSLIDLNISYSDLCSPLIKSNYQCEQKI